MAFCKYCGTKLEENQLCSCEQAVASRAATAAPAPEATAAPAPEVTSAPAPEATSAPAPEATAPANTLAADYAKLGLGALKATWTTFLNTIRKPADAGAGFVKEGSVTVAGILIALKSLLYAIVVAILVARINSAFSNDYFTILKISGAKWFFITLFGVAANIFIYAGLYLGGFKILKRNINFKQALRLSSLQAIPALPLIILGLLLVFIEPVLTLGLMLLIPIFGLVFMYQATNGIEEVNDNSKGYVLLTIYTIVTLITFIVVYELIASDLQTAISSLTSSLFNFF